MISETDIVAGYMWILGRMPAPDECAATRDRFRDSGDDTLATFQYELLASIEFRNRRLLMQRMRHLTRPDLDQDRLVFLHVEKCGGTTLHEMLCSQFPAEQVCPERNDSLGDWTINELGHYRLFSGHYDFAWCRALPGSLRVVTMLREPKARLMSLYRFWKAHRPHPQRDFYDLLCLAREHSAEAFFDHPRVRTHPAVRDAITGQLTRSSPVWALAEGNLLIDDPDAALEQGWTALRSMAGFGILEAFEASRTLLNQRLGLDMQPVPPRQVLAAMVRDDPELVPHPPEPMTARLDGLLDALTGIDRRLYARARTTFEAATAAKPRVTLPGLRRWHAR